MTTAANGTHTIDGMPRTVTALTPLLAVIDARGAMAFYEDVFGATTVSVTEAPGPDGDRVVVHGVLDFAGRGRLELGEVNPAYHLVAPPAGEDSCYSIGIFVSDVDGVTARAAAAGATVREEPQDFVSGDRFASIGDPFGVRWSIMTRVEDLSDEESAARVAEWAKSLG